MLSTTGCENIAEEAELQESPGSVKPQLAFPSTARVSHDSATDSQRL